MSIRAAEDPIARGKRKKAKRDRVAKIKESTPCSDCSESYPSYVMQWHHVDRRDKVSSISTLCSQDATWNTILIEIGKCELVCANCHAERTHG